MRYTLNGSKSHLFMLRMRFRARDLYFRLKKLFVSDKAHLEKSYAKHAGGRLPDLEHPQDFSEKLLYLMLHYRNPLMTLCADKVYAAEYVRACGYPEILREIYAVADDARKIDFDSLPEEFFMRTNCRSGFNYAVKKSQIDLEHTKKFMNIVKNSDYYYQSREWQYKDMQPLVMCEELLRNKDGSPLVDYKFYCFSGQVKYFMISKGEYEHDVRNHKFTPDGKSIDHFFKEQATLAREEAEIPENIDKMLEIASVLCKPFPHVRVDLYDIDGRIVFGEMTFYSNAGVVNVQSQEFAREIGSWIELDKYQKDMR